MVSVLSLSEVDTWVSVLSLSEVDTWVSVLSLSAVDWVKPKTIKLVFVVSPLSTQH
jgi:hypothetical protein